MKYISCKIHDFMVKNLVGLVTQFRKKKVVTYIWLGCKFLEFLYGVIRFLIAANLLNLEPFGLSFPNGGSTL